MAIMTSALVSVSLIAAVWFAAAFCWKPSSALKSNVKTASVAGLALAAVLSGGPMMLVVALALGSVGDFFLSRTGQAAFLAGLSAFAAAHLAYVALLLAAGGGLVFGVASLVLICFGLGMAAVLFAHAEALRWPVLGYVAIILTMGLVAIGLPPTVRLAQVAALLFVVWIFYWGAQFLFLMSFAPGWGT